jgi:DNA integrity scanning protein DisA with diadenylate cyclase activity
MTNLTRNSESLVLKIDEALASLREYKEELDKLYHIEAIDYDTYLEVLDEMGIVVSQLIMDMRIAHDYKGHTDVLPHGTLQQPQAN